MSYNQPYSGSMNSPTMSGSMQMTGNMNMTGDYQMTGNMCHKGNYTNSGSLLVTGSVQLLPGQSGPPSVPGASLGGIIYVKSDDKLYYVSNAISEVELSTHSGGGGGSSRSVAGDTENGVITWKTSDNTFVNESTLTYDGTTLSGSGNVAAVGTIKSTGNIATSGSLTAATIGAFTAAGAINFDNQDMTNVDIDSGAIDGTTIGASSPSTGEFTNISGSGTLQVFGTVKSTGAISTSGSVTAAGFVSTANVDIGAYEMRAQTFESDVSTGTAPIVVASTTECTNLNAAKLSGADWGAPPAIGSTTPGAGSFTNVSGSGTLQVVGALTAGTIATSGSLTVGVLGSASDISGSGDFHVVGTVTSTGNIGTSGSVNAGAVNTNAASSLDAAVVINESAGNNDFRVEAQVVGSAVSHTHMLHVDASQAAVGVNSQYPRSAFDVIDVISYSGWGSYWTSSLDQIGACGGRRMVYSPGGNTTVTTGSLYFLHSGSVWYKADADVAESGSSHLLGIPGYSGLAADGVNAQSSSMFIPFLLEGYARVPNAVVLNKPANIAGQPLYVSTTAGSFDFTAPSGTGDCVRVIGYAISKDATTSDVLVYFKPDPTWVEIT